MCPGFGGVEYQRQQVYIWEFIILLREIDDHRAGQEGKASRGCSRRAQTYCFEMIVPNTG